MAEPKDFISKGRLDALSWFSSRQRSLGPIGAICGVDAVRPQPIRARGEHNQGGRDKISRAIFSYEDLKQ